MPQELVASEGSTEELPLPTYAEALEGIVKELMNKDESDEVILSPPPPTYVEAIQFKKDDSSWFKKDNNAMIFSVIWEKDKKSCRKEWKLNIFAIKQCLSEMW